MDSKFGMGVRSQKADILAAFVQYPWLSGLHFHTGSQGCPVDMLMESARTVAGLLAELEAVLEKGRITTVNIGGGLSVDYDHVANAMPGFKAYALALQESMPAVFSRAVAGQLTLVTEFGRAIFAKAGFVASVVEYTKSLPPPGWDGHAPLLVADNRTQLTINVGADCFLRTAYLPDKWHHRVSLHCLDEATPPLRLRDAAETLAGPGCHRASIVGPLCFSGDTLKAECYFPAGAPLEAGAAVVIHDAGAYTLYVRTFLLPPWQQFCVPGPHPFWHPFLVFAVCLSTDLPGVCGRTTTVGKPHQYGCFGWKMVV